jgi:hypothetical protein
LASGYKQSYGGVVEKGTQYLVFAAGKPASTTLLCWWTEPAERATAKIEWLDQRTKHP